MGAVIAPICYLLSFTKKPISATKAPTKEKIAGDGFILEKPIAIPANPRQIPTIPSFIPFIIQSSFLLFSLFFTALSKHSPIAKIGNRTLRQRKPWGSPKSILASMNRPNNQAPSVDTIAVIYIADLLNCLVLFIIIA